MCGICGCIRFDGSPVNADTLRNSCGSLRHRGPDAQGVWIDAGHGSTVGLAAARLAVLDPLHRADQPIHRHNRFHIAFNGEVYNFRKVREELVALSEEFVTEGDAEVVLAACARWGVDALTRFNGMWALAVYDSQTRCGFLARDRFGVKPLFYSVHKSRLQFASELVGISALGDFDHEIDQNAVVGLLTFGFINQPRTIYSAVKKLPPGHYLTFDARGASPPVRYHKPHPRMNLPSEEGELRACLRRTIADAVAIRKVSDVPIGAFLSGGVDSTIVAYHLAEAVGRPLNTFSIGFEDSHYDESRFARLAASRIGTQHHELTLTTKDLCDALPRILDHLSEPFGDSSILPTALLSEHARTGVTVALSGDAGDELFGGYWRYLAHESLKTYFRLPHWLRHSFLEPLLSRFSSSKSSGFSNRVRQYRKLLRAVGGCNALERHLMWMRILSPEAENIFKNRNWVIESSNDFGESESIPEVVSGGKYTSNDDLNRIFRFDLENSLPADMLHKVDMASMMHSLEVRTPFLDPSVVELALAIPADQKVYRGLRKKILVDAYRGILPDEILDRPKQGFEVPFGELIRGPLRSLFHDVVTAQTIESFGLLSYPNVMAVFGAHCERLAEHADLLFAILSLCWWRSRR
ncbi:MAG: asparagine synthase (glutamine-hydrolyzing) [Planctomycetes bacterium]|nr:asparagine synthase (glutamine-hydrolyzing) [Planctomycetota bacterium]